MCVSRLRPGEGIKFTQLIFICYAHTGITKARFRAALNGTEHSSCYANGMLLLELRLTLWRSHDVSFRYFRSNIDPPFFRAVEFAPCMLDFWSRLTCLQGVSSRDPANKIVSRLHTIASACSILRRQPSRVGISVHRGPKATRSAARTIAPSAMMDSRRRI